MFRVPHGHDTSASSAKFVSGQTIEIVKFLFPETEGIKVMAD